MVDLTAQLNAQTRESSDGRLRRGPPIGEKIRVFFISLGCQVVILLLTVKSM